VRETTRSLDVKARAVTVEGIRRNLIVAQSALRRISARLTRKQSREAFPSANATGAGAALARLRICTLA
jgi:hypothetical protein